MNPLTEFLRAWGKWIVIGVMIAGLAWYADHQGQRADIAEQKVETVSAEKKAVEDREVRLIEERKVLVANQAKWSEAFKRIDSLARVSASARAIEAGQLNDIAASVAAAKEGIKHAPGADDHFDFSDAAYGLVRNKPAITDPTSDRSGSAASGTPGVGGR